MEIVIIISAFIDIQFIHRAQKYIVILSTVAYKYRFIFKYRNIYISAALYAISFEYFCSFMHSNYIYLFPKY